MNEERGMGVKTSYVIPVTLGPTVLLVESACNSCLIPRRERESRHGAHERTGVSTAPQSDRQTPPNSPSFLSHVIQDGLILAIDLMMTLSSNPPASTPQGLEL